jgi:hypothetical protein
MDKEDLIKQLIAIANEEHTKMTDGCGGLTEEGHTPVDIHAFSILNTPLLGIQYWYSDICGAGYVFNILCFELCAGNKTRYFDSRNELDYFLRTTKIKDFKNPFKCIITKKYTSTLDIEYMISDSILEQIRTPLLLKKTTIIDYAKK